jgi:hypothetical protein
LAASSFVSRLGKPNIHGLPDFLYLPGKVAYYFLLHLSGLRIWSDVRPEQGMPFVTWRLPPWLCIGADRVVGIVYPDWRYPVSTLVVCLTVFGLGPLLVLYLLRRLEKTRSLPFAIELALFYGVASYLAGPLLGDWVERLVGYGWTAFWIALPCLWYWYGPRLKAAPATLLAVGYGVSCWWPRICGYGNGRGVNPWPCFGVLLIYLGAVYLLLSMSEGKPWRCRESLARSGDRA